MTSKAIKFFCALLLLPALPPLVLDLWRRARELNARVLFLENPLAFCLGGLVLWGFFALFFRFPTGVYVAAHELTHALFVKLCGGRVKKISVRSDRGFVLSDRTNFLIALAPYLFPLYAGLWSLLGLATVFWIPFARWQAIFWVGLGFCLGYHWTMTGRMLTTRQSDFSSQGYFFSFTLILITNLALLLLVLFVLPTPRELPHHILRLGGDLLHSYQQALHFLRARLP